MQAYTQVVEELTLGTRVAIACNHYDEVPVSELTLPDHNRVRFLNICNAADIKTIGDLVKCGSYNFMKFRNVGKGSIDYGKRALMEQFGIRW